MAARKLAALLAISLTSATIAFAPAASAEPAAQSSGLLGGLNDLLQGTVGTVVDTTGQTVASVDPTSGVLTGATGQVLGTVDQVTGQLFDTTGQLLGTIDASTGFLLDPFGNVIGALLPASGAGGENHVDSPAGQTPQGSGLALSISAPRVQRLSTVSRRGLQATARCSATCGVIAAVTVDGRTARRLRLGTGVRAVTVGTVARGAAGRLAVRLKSRARRALGAALPTSSTRARVRRGKLAAMRQARSGDRRAARRLARLRRQERRFLRGTVKLTVAAMAIDRAGRTSTVRRQSLLIKR